MGNNTDFSAVIRNIMANPEFAGMVSELRGENGKKSTEEITGDMMAQLPQILSAAAPMLASLSVGDSGDKSPETPPVKEDGEEDRDNRIKTEQHTEILPKKYDKVRAEKLLYAIKPYLNPTRCSIIDKCVSVLQLTDVMGVLQGLDGLFRPDEKQIGGEH